MTDGSTVHGYSAGTCPQCGGVLKNAAENLTKIQKDLRDHCLTQAWLVENVTSGELEAAYLEFNGHTEESFVDEYLSWGYTNDDVRRAKIRALVEKAYDIDVTVFTSGDYRSSRLLLAGNGPDIWLDTRTCEVQGQWGAERWTVDVSAEATDAISAEVQSIWETSHP
ncbi:MAG: hypothetical protein FWD75_06635 [Propionibacteriaceae bacterium]|nr:hypothetical protein [Propionibacteriaceae bacterium]